MEPTPLIDPGTLDAGTLERLADDDPRVDILWLYGSRARCEARPDSDYDLAVAFNQFPEDAWERRLQPELLAMDWAEALELPSDRLSVVDINQAPLPLARAIVTGGQVLFCRDPLRLAREENRIASMWELDHQYQQQQRHG
ncbi:nucleotidyltransferase domain-containing protein [Thioalkalivibrio sp. ALJ24]|uniref:type VII toxin-antitoxin system MntA family adenylyltransferase antitoxin n=1 Tax=Thioalkalivibrio sp. ALJ24 TaxID=545276 RepID=UPI00037DCBD1|nr:nucleotidyltransferase domain-containing protein [Thioalkalivibrio sp. ALJ24]